MAIVTALLILACDKGGEPVASQLNSHRTVSADTIVVTSEGTPRVLRGGEVRVIWQSPELEQPLAMVAIGDHFAVADRAVVHLLSKAGRPLRTVGREGEGPGEFLYIASLGQIGRDTLVVYDAANYRMTFLSAAGDYVGSMKIAPPRSFVNPLTASDRGGPTRGFVPNAGGVLSLWRDGVFSDGTRPTKTALVWWDIVADTMSVLEEWAGERWIKEGGYVAPAELYGPRVITAWGRDGRLAIGNGTDYCVLVRSDETLQKICRVRSPTRVGPQIRNPDLSRVRTERRREGVKALLNRQHIGDHLPHFDRLLFDDDGGLWVRTIGLESSHVSPYLLRDAPELRPMERTWDVFNRDGELLKALELPSNFEPQVISSGEIYGFVELQTGEIAIGASTIPMPF